MPTTVTIITYSVNVYSTVVYWQNVLPVTEIFADSTFIQCTARNLELAADLLRVQVNSAFYSGRTGDE